MPTYEYACVSCGRHTEVVQSFRDEPLTECPHCGGVLKRVFHPVGILLKGSGFYSTDNRGKRAKTGAKEPDKTEKKTDSKTETKPDTASKPAQSASGSSTDKS